MRTLLQIDTCLNSRSTGRIAEQIGVIAQKNDYKCYIAYGRYATKSQNIPIKIGNKLNTYWHKVETLVFDRDIFGSLYPTKRLIKRIEEIKPDIIHLHNVHGFYIDIRILFEYLSKKDIPIVWTLHDCWTFTGHCSYFDYIHCDKWKTLCHHCPQKTSYPMSLLLDNSKNNYLNKRKLFNSVKNITFVPVSYWLESLLKQSFLSKYPTNVIQNGTDIHTFHRINTPQNQLKKKYNLQNKFIILGVASIWTPRKGLQEFIKLSQKLEKDEQIVLIGLSKRQIKDLPEGVLGIERTENVQQLCEFYNISDVFFNPTWEDNFPTTNIESLACGLPVVTYRTGGSVESVDSNVGWVINQGKIEDFVQIIRQMRQENDQTKEQRRTFCRQKAEKFYNKDNVFQQYIDLYNRILQAK